MVEFQSKSNRNDPQNNPQAFPLRDSAELSLLSSGGSWERNRLIGTKPQLDQTTNHHIHSHRLRACIINSPAILCRKFEL